MNIPILRIFKTLVTSHNTRGLPLPHRSIRAATKSSVSEPRSTNITRKGCVISILRLNKENLVFWDPKSSFHLLARKTNPPHNFHLHFLRVAHMIPVRSKTTTNQQKRRVCMKNITPKQKSVKARKNINLNVVVLQSSHEIIEKAISIFT